MNILQWTILMQNEYATERQYRISPNMKPNINQERDTEQKKDFISKIIKDQSLMMDLSKQQPCLSPLRMAYNNKMKHIWEREN
jgi:hypothetical protein